MEASFIIFKLSPYFENFGKRIAKSPKYYFTDTGLLSFLLDIEKPEQLLRDPLIGNIFENLVILEALKARYNQGLKPNLYFYRDHQGREIDLLFKSASTLTGIEIKSASTWNNSFKRNLVQFSKNNRPLTRRYIIYSGDQREFSDGVSAVNYKNTSELLTKGELP